MVDDGFDSLRRAANGQREDYRLDGRPLSDEGGQARIFRGVHKTSGLEVAMKRLRSATQEAVARMRREISVGRKLAGHPHVMPVLDASTKHDWFVMPLAEGNAEDFLKELARDPAELRKLIESVSEALRAAHGLGWVHRDVKPANILRRGGTWLLADWGLGRGPRGETTLKDRTRVGHSYGTEGFAAPELSTNAHEATPAADIFSLGQIIGWALTGEWPRANIPLVPPSGPWRSIVRRATRLNPEDRPQTIDAFLELVALHLNETPKLPIAHATETIQLLRAGEDVLEDLLTYAAEHHEEQEIFIDVLPQLSEDEVRRGVDSDSDRAAELVRAMGEHLDSDWGQRAYKWADAVIIWIFHVAKAAARLDDIDLLEEAVLVLCRWDERWDQWAPQRPIATWLRSLSGAKAEVVAAVLRDHPDSAHHFEELSTESRVDLRIRQAVAQG